MEGNLSHVMRIEKLSEAEPTAVLAERRCALISADSKNVTGAGCVIIPTSGTWMGQYTEDGLTGITKYELQFDFENETFSGTGSDADGLFDVELGCFDAKSRQFIWSERTVRGGRTALFTECKGKVSIRDSFKCIIEGWYQSSTGRTGKITLRPVLDPGTPI